MTCKKELAALKDSVKKLKEENTYLLEQLKVTDSIVNKLDIAFAKADLH